MVRVRLRVARESAVTEEPRSPIPSPTPTPTPTPAPNSNPNPNPNPKMKVTEEPRSTQMEIVPKPISPYISLYLPTSHRGAEEHPDGGDLDEREEHGARREV